MVLRATNRWTGGQSSESLLFPCRCDVIIAGFRLKVVDFELQFFIELVELVVLGQKLLYLSLEVVQSHSVRVLILVKRALLGRDALLEG